MLKPYSSSRDFWFVNRVICASDSESTETFDFWSYCVVYPPALWSRLKYCWKWFRWGLKTNDQSLPIYCPSLCSLPTNLSCFGHSTLTPLREDSKNLIFFFYRLSFFSLSLSCVAVWKLQIKDGEFKKAHVISFLSEVSI